MYAMTIPGTAIMIKSPAIVGSVNATELLTEQDTVTVSCSEGETGIVYQGKLDYEIKVQEDGDLPKLPIKLMMNVGNPDMAFTFAQIPNHGVGLARLEFVINNMIGIHPKAIINYKAMPAEIQKIIDHRAKGYKNPKQFYIDKIKEKVVAAQYSKVFFSKAMSFNGRAIGELQFQDIFEKNGFAIFHPEKMSMYVVISVLKGCDEFVATSGTSAHNSIFMTDGKAIICLNRSAHFHPLQIMIDRMKSLKVTYIDVFLFSTAQNFGNAPCFLTMTGFLRKYINERNFRYNRIRFFCCYCNSIFSVMNHEFFAKGIYEMFGSTSDFYSMR